ncbi:MAG: MBOAT family protein [Coriobacteriia bacterium]|nr:MBOAT family protein [Coriobacteriia bacterium]
MVFSSLTFLCVFLPVVFIVYQVLPGLKSKNALLIIASLFFYAYGEPVYVVLMIVSTIINWLFGLLVVNNKYQKLFVILSIIANLGFLAIFKYADFFVETINNVFESNFELPNIALPIGISFYTFQAMSYVIDVYRGVVNKQKNYFYVLLYISFFPQLIAGPIVKYKDIEKQLNDRHATIDDITSGLIRFCVGLAKKVLIANTMGQIVDAIYASNQNEINICVAWIAALCYIMQIYFDFCAYSDMAIGMAKIFGFHFKENFNYPYISTSIKEFWRRWHISLSTWFRDYLYIPLGGNRKGRPRTAINKVIVFACCGLWHGASWTFLVWGLLHGLALMLEDYIPIKKLPKALGFIYTLLIVTILFVIFRADTLSNAGFMLSQMFTGFHFEESCVSLGLSMLTPLNITTFIFAIVAAFKVGQVLYVKTLKGHVCIQCILALVLLVLCILTLSGGGYNPFIYFRF